MKECTVTKKTCFARTDLKSVWGLSMRNSTVKTRRNGQQAEAAGTGADPVFWERVCLSSKLLLAPQPHQIHNCFSTSYQLKTVNQLKTAWLHFSCCQHPFQYSSSSVLSSNARKVMSTLLPSAVGGRCIVSFWSPPLRNSDAADA